MADDLEDEWWAPGDNLGLPEVEEDTQPSAEEDTQPSAEEDTQPSAEEDTQPSAEEDTQPSAEEPQTTSTSKKRKSEKQIQENTTEKKRKKTVQKECFITQERSEDTGDKESKTQKKRRKKKKTITDVLASSEPLPGAPDDLRSLLKGHYSQTLSVIEQDEVTLQDSCFLSSNDLTHSLSSYLKEVCPKWAKIQKQHTQTRSIMLLIVCASALRTIDLIKQLVAFNGQGKVLKLFAKHIKLDDHIKLLSKGVTHIGVGTPGRLAALLEKEGLTVQGLRYLILDWNHRDQKHRRMVDIPEVKRDLLKMMDLGVVQSCREGAVKIGLF